MEETLEEKVESLEKRIAALEGLVQAQPITDLIAGLEFYINRSKN